MRRRAWREKGTTCTSDAKVELGVYLLIQAFVGSSVPSGSGRRVAASHACLQSHKAHRSRSTLLCGDLPHACLTRCAAFWHTTAFCPALAGRMPLALEDRSALYSASHMQSPRVWDLVFLSEHEGTCDTGTLARSNLCMQVVQQLVGPYKLQLQGGRGSRAVPASLSPPAIVHTRLPTSDQARGYVGFRFLSAYVRTSRFCPCSLLMFRTACVCLLL